MSTPALSYYSFPLKYPSCIENINGLWSILFEIILLKESPSDLAWLVYVLATFKRNAYKGQFSTEPDFASSAEFWFDARVWRQWGSGPWALLSVLPVCVPRARSHATDCPPDSFLSAVQGIIVCAFLQVLCYTAVYSRCLVHFSTSALFGEEGFAPS